MLAFIKRNRLLFLIFIIGLVLRLLGLKNIVPAGDTLNYWNTAGSIVRGESFPLLGPSASINSNFHFGPFYYYFLTIPYILGFGNFKAAIIFISIINSFSILLLYFVSKKLFGKKAGLKICALYSFSSFIIQTNNLPWNAFILPSFIIVSLYFIQKIQDKKYHYFPVLMSIYAVSIQAHPTAVVLLPIFLFMMPIKKISLKYYLFGGLLFLFISSPWLYADFASNFNQSKELIKIFQVKAVQNCSFARWFVYHGHGETCFWYLRNTLFIFKTSTMSLFNTQNILVVFISMLTSIWYFVKTKAIEKKIYLPWFISVFVLFIFYKGNVYIHYFLALIPMPFFLFVGILERLKKHQKPGVIFSNILFYSTIVLNLVQYLYSLQINRY